jgi:hypothetical protein
MMPREDRPATTAVPSLIKDLVDQFDRPLDFYRELLQNAIDAGANRVDVSLEHDGERALIRVDDDGEGMDEDVIDNYLLVKFRSTKEGDFTKIGKFGIGFVSVFALRPDLVRLYTSKGGENWRLDFPSYKRYEKYKLNTPREGTLVELVKRMTRHDFDKLVLESRQAIRYWCKHAEARIYFRADVSGPELLTEPFGLEEASLTYAEEGTDISLAFTADDKPFFGFYNRGLTLKEGREALFPGVKFKAKSRYLEHTLTRDNVMMDENYHKLLAIVGRLVEDELPKRLQEELADISARISSIHSRWPGPEGAQDAEAELAKLGQAWADRETFLCRLCAGFFARWKRSDWAVYPSLSGKPIALSDIRASVEQTDHKLYFDKTPNRITRALSRQGLIVLPEGHWTDSLAAWLRATAVRASDALMLPEVVPDGKLPAAMRSFLATLRQLDEGCGVKYRGIAAADLSSPGSPVRDRMFVTQKEAGSLSSVADRQESSLLWFRKPRWWALLSVSHPAVEKLARLHAARPGLAAFLCLKMMHLSDGDVPPEKESEYSNLAEKVEARLLSGALRIDRSRTR